MKAICSCECLNLTNGGNSFQPLRKVLEGVRLLPLEKTGVIASWVGKRDYYPHKAVAIADISKTYTVQDFYRDSFLSVD